MIFFVVVVNDSFKSVCLFSGYLVIKNILQCGWQCRPGNRGVMSVGFMLINREIVIHCDVLDCIKLKLVFASFTRC